ncbi:MAG: hypothetical protein KA715_09165 [Xanthomonadaceae bacterium]|nr:hypothetical protein [Xanthomonadaceae bacterium]
MIRQDVRIFALIAVAITATACGKNTNSLVKKVAAQATTMNGDIYAAVSADLNTETYSVAAFSLPIIDPNNPAIQYGSISLKPNAIGGGGRIVISVNVSKAAHINSSVATTLPNGTAFPLGLPPTDNLVAIPIGNNGAKLYVLMGANTLMIGTAIPFSALNDVGRYVPGVNVFSSVSFGKINSFIGVFAGSEINQTGLGIFADLSQILPNQPTVAPEVIASSESSSVSAVSGESQASSSGASSTPVVKITLNGSAQGSKETQRQLAYHLWRVSEEGPAVLRYR